MEGLISTRARCWGKLLHKGEECTERDPWKEGRNPANIEGGSGTLRRKDQVRGKVLGSLKSELNEEIEIFATQRGEKKKGRNEGFCQRSQPNDLRSQRKMGIGRERKESIEMASII